MNDQLYYIHWKSGHREGWTPIPFTQQDAAAIIKARKESDPDAVFDLIPVKAEQ